MTRKILVTGAAGFIGFHLCKQLIYNQEKVIGIDNINSYYDIKLKEDRLNKIKNSAVNLKENWKFFRGDINDIGFLENIIKEEKPSIIINLAAQAGVRYSLENPRAYINTNIIGFFNILECCRKFGIKKLIYASSSSVYGGNKKIPFSESDSVKYPVSLYAATKLSNENMAYTYSHLYSISTVGLRFFTVYGPWGRPDMAPMIFTNAIFKNSPIKVFNKGNMSRDFTYIDDVVEILIRAIKKIETNSKVNKNNTHEQKTNNAPALIFNLGNSNPVNLMKFIVILEKEIGKNAIKEYEPMQAGDVKKTFADNTKIEKWLNYKPTINLSKGIKKFIHWYKIYYEV